MKITVINGPNINLTGIREKQIYGTGSYDDLCEGIMRRASDHAMECEVFQSNHEGDIIDRIQKCLGEDTAIIINAGGYSHTSVAILDALRAVEVPCVEVHMSDISSREEFRRFTYTSLACEKTFMGEGFESYMKAVDYISEKYNGK
ncbi:MAG: 3-dehydroquinate dehydratase [Eubacteriaceae bacterium]|nr:3-dehydroquinate dehydratase [Eubacteriaceae bacterium]MBR2780731.1 3-dehydroquinate dehydratase [Eubacteriaceae bacterium]